MKKQHFYMVIIFFSIFLTGCAGTKGGVDLVEPVVSESQMGKYTNLQIKVKSTDTKMKKADKNRVKNLIKLEVNSEQPNRFKSINSKSSNRKKMLATVNITRYEKGSKFARFMLIGLGQIHIDEDIVLTDYFSKNKLAQYQVTKTYAWGGMIGAMTDIKDVETGFSKAVASSILGDD